MDISFQKSSLEQLSSHNTAEARQMEERIDLLKKKHADQINETVKAFEERCLKHVSHIEQLFLQKSEMVAKSE